MLALAVLVAVALVAVTVVAIEWEQSAAPVG